MAYRGLVDDLVLAGLFALVEILVSDIDPLVDGVVAGIIGEACSDGDFYVVFAECEIFFFNGGAELFDEGAVITYCA